MDHIEDKEDNLDEGLSYAQRRRRAAVFRKYSAKIKLAREKAIRRASTNKKIAKRARKAAIMKMSTKLAGGRDPSTLSAGEKSRIEDLVKKRKGAIRRWTIRLMPIVRQRERSRLRGGIKEAADNNAGLDTTSATKTKKKVIKDINNKKYIEFFNADSMKEEFREFMLQNGYLSEDEIVLFNIDKIVEELFEKNGLWDNIHAKRERIKHGSGERMRKPGSKGAPTDADFKSAKS